MLAPTRTSLTVAGVPCCSWTWLPGGGKPSKGLVVFFHGMGAHGRFPSVRVGAEAVARGGFTVVCPDFAGHGESGGLRGYIASADALEQAAAAFIESAQAAHRGLPLFLAGSSMGGAIAFRMALRLGPERVCGIVLLAPMLAPAASASAQALLTILSYTPLATLALIPSSSSSNAKQHASTRNAWPENSRGGVERRTAPGACRGPLSSPVADAAVPPHAEA